MGEGKHYNGPHSRTTGIPSIRSNKGQKGSSVNFTQDKVVQTRILNLLTQLNNQLKEYIDGCISIVSIDSIHNDQALQDAFSAYKTIIIENLETKNLPALQRWIEQSHNDSRVIDELRKIYDQQNKLYQHIEADIQQYCAHLKNSFEAHSDIESSKKQTVQELLQVVVDYIKTCRATHQATSKQLSTTFGSYERDQAKMLQRARTNSTNTNEIGFTTQPNQIYTHANIANEQFEALLKGYSHQESTNEGHVVALADRRMLLNPLRDLLKQVERLKTDLQGVADTIAEHAVKGFEVNAIENVFQSQYDSLAYFTQQIEEGELSTPLSVPNVIQLFENGVVSLYGHFEQSLIIWKHHFKLAQQDLPKKWNFLNEAVKELESLGQTEWKTQSDQPMWTENELLFKISHLLSHQQRCVAQQGAFIEHIKVIDLHPNLADTVEEFFANEKALLPLIRSESSSATSSARSSASFFPETRRFSGESNTSVDSERPPTAPDLSSDFTALNKG